MPDSAEIYDQMYLEQMLKDKEDKKKIFGHDIFNNKNLTFEPNMNIATPQDYRLGPGDAVFIDIYGASQNTIESTVSPDGTIRTGERERSYRGRGQLAAALHTGTTLQQL